MLAILGAAIFGIILDHHVALGNDIMDEFVPGLVGHVGREGSSGDSHDWILLGDEFDESEIVSSVSSSFGWYIFENFEKEGAKRTNRS